MKEIEKTEKGGTYEGPCALIRLHNDLYLTENYGTFTKDINEAKIFLSVKQALTEHKSDLVLIVPIKVRVMQVAPAFPAKELVDQVPKVAEHYYSGGKISSGAISADSSLKSLLKDIEFQPLPEKYVFNEELKKYIKEINKKLE